MYQDLSFMTIPLPEDVLKLKIYGDYAGAQKMIRYFLEEKDIPQALRKRLEIEQEVIGVMGGNEYPFTYDEALEIMTSHLRDFKKEELDHLKEISAADWIYIDGEVHFHRQTPFFQAAPHKARSPRFPTDTDESAGRPNTWKMLSVPAESGIQPALPYLSKFPDFSLKASHPPHKMACGSPPCPGEPQPPPVPASVFLPFLLASIFPVHSLPAPKKRKIKPVSYMEVFLS